MEDKKTLQHAVRSRNPQKLIHGLTTYQPNCTYINVVMNCGNLHILDVLATLTATVIISDKTNKQKAISRLKIHSTIQHICKNI